MYSKRIIVGARGSVLSIQQAGEVIGILKKEFPSSEFIRKTITTTGDRIKNSLPKEKGLFVKEIEEALLEGSVNLAVHSLKDMPTEIASGLILGAVTKRRESYDAFISRKRVTFSGLKKGAVVATGSLRRRAQILALQRDLKVIEIRGNIDTRLRKLRQGYCDGIICALCALKRLGVKNTIHQRLSVRHFLPAPGQGALGIEARRDDSAMIHFLERINHFNSYVCTQAERDFLKYLGGGCRLPVGALATIQGNCITLRGFVAEPDGSFIIRLREVSNLKNAKAIGKKLARKAIKRGALKILNRLR